MPLTDAACRGAKPDPSGKPRKIPDGGGLLLFVSPSGGKLWRMRYRFDGKEKLLSFGAYPEIKLADARALRDKAKRALAEGRDPGANAKAAMTAPAGDTFEAVAREWIKAQAATWTPAHSTRLLSRFERDVFPAIGATAVVEVTAPQILAMLRPVEDRAPDVAGRVRMTTGAIMRYAVATGRASRDPAADLRGALKPTPRVKHMARIEAGELSSFLQKLARYDGEPQTRCAIEFVMHTFVRTNELRFGKWSEIDGDVWRIPGSRMKMSRDHIVPLTRQSLPFAPRRDGIGRPVPNATLKVPTGGGKTWLAVNAVSRIMGRYLGKNTGFVLWIVPNEAIYSQTLKHLKNRQHPYRQALDRAAAGRVKVMEKGDRLDARDVEANLCVMVLMLQAANRQTQETLRMFRDRGDVHGFFAPEGDQAAHARELAAVPNLDGYLGMFPMVKDSLGNALRKIRPVVVMDEGQKATSELAHDTLYGFNPIFVLELTATPKDVAERRGAEPRPARYANLLVEVTGRELHAEDMIKMPLNLDPRQGADWRGTLTAALGRLNAVQTEALAYGADRGALGYIRPIMLVQVERTGRDQRDGLHIHAEDVKDWLLASGLDAAEVAIKTAEQNDLNAPENQDLLSPTNRVRVIVTKAALQEGWDCPFAYVLCSLAAASNLSAMTQLVGRILRQPYALKTGNPALDECYVVTHHASTSDVVDAIKSGLERDGLADLVIEIPQGGAAPNPGIARKIERRSGLHNLKIYLPRMLRVDGGALRELDYGTDILAAIDWRNWSPSAVAAAIPDNPKQAAAQLQRITLTDAGEDEYFRGEAIAAAAETLRFDPSYSVRVISDLVPNPFVARGIIAELVAALEQRGFDSAKLGAASGVIVDTLRLALVKERDARAEALFRAEVQAGRVQFRLRLDGNNWPMPDHILSTEPANSPHLTGADGGALTRSLFSPIHRSELNGEEQNVAVHLDGDAAVKWWHRNVAKTNYGLQGWKRGRIYPDFIFASGGNAGAGRIVVMETKGDHLQNPDTDYKRDVLDFLTENFSWDQAMPAGQLQITMTGETVECALVLMEDIPVKLPALLAR